MSMPPKLRLVFMGTPAFAVPSLLALHEQHEVLLVVTQPDRPRGRGRALAVSPVKEAAQRLEVPVMQPERLRRRSVRERLAELSADMFVVAAFGQILSARLLTVPRLGCVNVHASLLPRYRGAAPIQWAVCNDERQSGISIMQMDSGVDTGPVWLQRSVALDAEETAGTLHDKLAALGAPLLVEALELIQDGRTQPTPQDNALATHAPMLRKEDGRVDFAAPANRVACWVRGMDPWPGAFTTLHDRTLRCFGAVASSESGAPGEVLAVDDRGLLVACGTGAVWLRELQPAGRRRMSARAFTAGNPVEPGTVLG
jgi:methionyl-tRNA formyltransferase